MLQQRLLLRGECLPSRPAFVPVAARISSPASLRLQVEFTGKSCSNPNLNYYIAFSTIFFVLCAISFVQLVSSLAVTLGSSKRLIHFVSPPCPDTVYKFRVQPRQAQVAGEGPANNHPEGALLFHLYRHRNSRLLFSVLVQRVTQMGVRPQVRLLSAAAVRLVASRLLLGR